MWLVLVKVVMMILSRVRDDFVGHFGGAAVPRAIVNVEVGSLRMANIPRAVCAIERISLFTPKSIQRRVIDVLFILKVEVAMS